MPTFVLAFNYWLHLLATVVWIGGLATLTLFAGMGLHHDDATSQAVFDRLERRFRPLANVSLIVLIVTGMIQMDGDPNYEGLLAVSNAWSVGMLIKHLVVLAMIIVAAVLQFGLYPALERARLAASRSAASADEAAALQRRLRRLMLVNLLLGVIVLLMTAYITAL